MSARNTARNGGDDTAASAASRTRAGLKVLVLGPDDWRLWRRVRRAALTEAPAAFGSTLEQWTGDRDTEQRWRGRLESVPLNLVISSEGELVGMVSATSPRPDGDVELISLWVAPTARGAGVGDEAVAQVAAWAATAHPASTVVLSVRTDNDAARRLYERHGFVDVGPSPDDPAETLMRRTRAAGPD